MAAVALIVLGAILLDCGVYWIYEIVAQKRVTEVAEALVHHKTRTHERDRSSAV